MNEEYFLYLDAKNGARKELAKLRKLERATQNEEITKQANRIRKRISIYSQKLIDIKKRLRPASIESNENSSKEIIP